MEYDLSIKKVKKQKFFKIYFNYKSNVFSIDICPISL